MKKIVVSMALSAGFCYAVEPEIKTTTQIKEQIQHIEVPAHIKGLRIVNNNTVRWSDTLPPAYVSSPTANYSRAYGQHPAKDMQLSRWRSLLLVLVGGAVVYGVARAYVYLLAQELENKTHWWHWKSELLLSALMQQPEQQLAQELLADIQERYAKTPMHDAAFIMPLVHFIQDTSYERDYLEHLIKIYECLRSYRLHQMVGADERIIESARTKLARIVYIRGLCMKWLSSYAVDVPAVA